MPKRFIVDLSEEERAGLLARLGKGAARTRELTRARILLLADEGRRDEAIAAVLHVHAATVARTRRRFVEGGVERALSDQPRPGGRPKLDSGPGRAGLRPSPRRSQPLDHAAFGRPLGRTRGCRHSQ